MPIAVVYVLFRNVIIDNSAGPLLVNNCLAVAERPSKYIIAKTPQNGIYTQCYILEEELRSKNSKSI
jgi:hypothetical protein